MHNLKSEEKDFPMFKFLNLLEKQEKIKFSSIFFLMLIASFLEVLSV